MKTKLTSAQSVFLVITSAVGIGGEIARAGAIVEVTDGEAKDMLNRGKARLATAEDGVDVSAASNEGAGAAGDADDQIDLTTLTKAQLLERATEAGIADADRMNKAALLAALEAHLAEGKSE
jgi:hypothetical protein